MENIIEYINAGNVILGSSLIVYMNDYINNIITFMLKSKLSKESMNYNKQCNLKNELKSQIAKDILNTFYTKIDKNQKIKLSINLDTTYGMISPKNCFEYELSATEFLETLTSNYIRTTSNIKNYEDLLIYNDKLNDKINKEIFYRNCFFDILGLSYEPLMRKLINETEDVEKILNLLEMSMTDYLNLICFNNSRILSYRRNYTPIYAVNSNNKVIKNIDSNLYIRLICTINKSSFINNLDINEKEKINRILINIAKDTNLFNNDEFNVFSQILLSVSRYDYSSKYQEFFYVYKDTILDVLKSVNKYSEIMEGVENSNYIKNKINESLKDFTMNDNLFKKYLSEEFLSARSILNYNKHITGKEELIKIYEFILKIDRDNIFKLDDKVKIKLNNSILEYSL